MGDRRNIVGVSWPDHPDFGEGGGKLDTVCGLHRRMERWRVEFGVGAPHWREVRTRSREARYDAARGNPWTHQRTIAAIAWDDFAVVPRLAHPLKLRALLYVSVLAAGWPPPRRERARSYHNAMHGRHVTRQTTWSRAHPEYAVVDRRGTTCQWRERSAEGEAALLARPAVAGLAFSTFRHDNPGAPARCDFVA